MNAGVVAASTCACGSPPSTDPASGCRCPPKKSTGVQLAGPPEVRTQPRSPGWRAARPRAGSPQGDGNRGAWAEAESHHALPAELKPRRGLPRERGTPTKTPAIPASSGLRHPRPRSRPPGKPGGSSLGLPGQSSAFTRQWPPSLQRRGSRVCAQNPPPPSGPGVARRPIHFRTQLPDRPHKNRRSTCGFLLYVT